MALDYCESCGSLEQGFREATPEEVISLKIEGDLDEWDNRICEECGEIGTRRGIPEHDELIDR